MTTLTEKEIYDFLDNNLSFEEITKHEANVEMSEMSDQQKKQALLALAWERAERREYIKALREVQDR